MSQDDDPLLEHEARAMSADATAVGAVPGMTVQMANALITKAPLSDASLHIARKHFRQLEAMLRISGPRMANARGLSADLHNAAVQRLKESAAAQRRNEVLQAERDADLVEIDPG